MWAVYGRLWPGVAGEAGDDRAAEDLGDALAGVEGIGYLRLMSCG
ncbi:MAG: hypothetical protein ACRDVM_10395 [Acidimicrobiia bacterium]